MAADAGAGGTPAPAIGHPRTPRPRTFHTFLAWLASPATLSGPQGPAPLEEGLHWLWPGLSDTLNQSATVVEEEQPPSGSDIWNQTSAWVTVLEWHPAGVISNINHGEVRWADVSYMSLNWLLVLSAVSYPAFLTFFILVLSVLVSMCLVTGPSEGEGGPDQPGGNAALQDPLYAPPMLPREGLAPISQKLYSLWRLLCCTIPALMVFGTPALIMSLARPYPQEVFSALTLLTSAFIFSNGVYMVIFAGSSLLRMRRSMATDYKEILRRAVAGQGAAAATQAPGQLPLPGCGTGVVHWVVLPQYKEDVKVVSMALSSICRSSLARDSICVVLAMEERERGADAKAEALRREFKGRFREVIVTRHPADLPNDPPGKASNLSWAFLELMQHLRAKQDEADLSQVVLTVADADSDFNEGYFESLTFSFLQAAEARYMRIWQAPMFHVKNYHRQPAAVVVGTMFTSMQELAALSDPNAVRFPYSTYSLSLDLARRVGGWDPDWIAEDYHMGIKCFLLTLGKASVEPILLPTVNYTPEDATTLGTIYARWSQGKRHAMGFSDLSYYFMMLPLIFSHAATRSTKERSFIHLHGFWSMATYGVTLLVRLMNIHVIIGVLSTYGALQTVLRLAMVVFFSSDRRVSLLFLRTNFCPILLMICSIISTLSVTVLFQYAYFLMKNRMEGPAYRSELLHWIRNALSIVVFGPFYFFALGLAIWMAALNVLLFRSFEYEVAPKPVAACGVGPNASEGSTAPSTPNRAQVECPS